MMINIKRKNNKPSSNRYIDDTCMLYSHVHIWIEAGWPKVDWNPGLLRPPCRHLYTTYLYKQLSTQWIKGYGGLQELPNCNKLMARSQKNGIYVECIEVCWYDTSVHIFEWFLWGIKPRKQWKNQRNARKKTKRQVIHRLTKTRECKYKFARSFMLFTKHGPLQFKIWNETLYMRYYLTICCKK